MPPGATSGVRSGRDSFMWWIAIVRHAGPRSRNVRIRWDMRRAIAILGAPGVTGGRGENGYSEAATATVARRGGAAGSLRARADDLRVGHELREAGRRGRVRQWLAGICVSLFL